MSKLKKNQQLTFKPLRLWAGLICAALLFVSIFFTPAINKLLKLEFDYSALAAGSYELHFVDVGQGDAILIRFSNGSTMLVDSGPAGARENLTTYIDNVFFRNSTRVFDYVVLTHGDSDHMGNMPYIVENYTIGTFYAPKQTEGTQNYKQLLTTLNNHATQNKIDLKYSQAGVVVEEGDELVTWLTPIAITYADSNDYSPIMLVEFTTCKVMLTGDASKEIGETEARGYFKDKVDIDILKLGHHGSNTSTDPVFLAEFTPEVAVVSCGLNNRYGHPSSQTLETLKAYDTQHNTNLFDYLSTAYQGNIIFYNNQQSQYAATFLANVNDYLFISWTYIALAGGVLLIILAVVPVRVKNSTWIKQQHKQLARKK